MFKKTICLCLALITILETNSIALAQSAFRGRLTTDTVTIRIFGEFINLTPALNIKLKFNNPDVAKLDSAKPIFQGLGASELLTEANPNTNTVGVLWDGYITNNEAKITIMLAPGTKTGNTNISVDKVFVAGNRDITNTIAYLIEPGSTSCIEVKDSILLGNISLETPEKLVGPGRAAISFKSENSTNNLTATLNGNNVEFLNNNTGIALIDLPANGGNIPLNLQISSTNGSETVNIGSIAVNAPANEGRKPNIHLAVAKNGNGNSDIKLFGRRFGLLRFGKENVNLEVVPKDQNLQRFNLDSRRARGFVEPSQCIKDGSYINIVTPSGTDVEKVRVVGTCNN